MHQPVVADQRHVDVVHAKELLAAPDDLVEDRRRVGDRLADDLENLGRRGLPLERLAGLVEEAYVLDRDHGLVGEGLQQLIWWRPNVPGSRRVTQSMPTDAPSRRSGHATMLRKPREGAARGCARRRETGISSSVSVDLHDTRAARIGPVGEVDRGEPESSRNAASPSASVGVKPTTYSLPSRKRQAEVEKPRDETVRCGGDGIEDRLRIAGRAGDDLEDLGGGGLALQRLAQRGGALHHLVFESFGPARVVEARPPPAPPACPACRGRRRRSGRRRLRCRRRGIRSARSGRSAARPGRIAARPARRPRGRGAG